MARKGLIGKRVAMRRDAGVMLERADVLSELRRCATEAATGSGRLLLVEAGGGLGKTTLLARFSRELGGSQFRVLTARGVEQERSHALGIVRQLLTRVLAVREMSTGPVDLAAIAMERMSFPGDPGGDPVDPWQVMHGLYWLIASVCQREPLALLIDDAHEADDASLQFVAYLARRLEGLPLLIVVAARPVGQAGGRRDLNAIRAEADAIELVALSQAATGELIREILGVACEPEFAAACHATTGGNPFYIRELLRETQGRGLAPVAASAAWVGEVGPPVILRSVLFRLAELLPGALETARAIAVLGDGARLVDCARLAELEPVVCARAADALATAGVFAGGSHLAFAHPILRTAVLTDLGEHQRAELYARAARQQLTAHAPVQAAAALILRAAPSADPDFVDVLRSAAGKARHDGSPSAAVDFLRRALEEPPREALRSDILFELGSAEGAQGLPAATDHLRMGLDTTVDPNLHGQRALVLAACLQKVGQPELVVDVLDEALSRQTHATSDLATTLHVERYWNSHINLRTVDRVGDGARHLRSALERPDDRIRRSAAGYLAMDAALFESRAAAARYAAEAVRPPGMTSFCAPDESAVFIALLALSTIEEHDRFETLADEVSAAGAHDGNLVAFLLVATVRAIEALSVGRLGDVQYEIDDAAGAAALPSFRHGEPGLVAAQIHALIDGGRVTEAWQALGDSSFAIDDPDDYPTGFLLDARGRLRTASGDARDGLTDLVRCGERMELLGVHSPGMVAWRSHAAEALLALGDPAEARRLAADELALARRLCGPIRQATALRVLARASDSDSALELLGSAVDLLRATPNTLEQARAHADLGVRLRRKRRLSEARDHLHAAMQAAALNDSPVLSSFIRDELIATGARPRRTHLYGRESLTPAELRVARLARDGQTNTAIAQALFLSPKTVEKHLANVYRKLAIDSRAGLHDALGDPVPTPDVRSAGPRMAGEA